MSTVFDELIRALARLPGLGPRSASRVALFLLEDSMRLKNFLRALNSAAESIVRCETCFTLDASSPCTICRDDTRDPSLLCVVESVSELWSVEHAGCFRGHYHVLGGVLSAVDQVSPEKLRIPQLLKRIEQNKISEVILATNATLEGRITSSYIASQLPNSVRASALAQGVPAGAELAFMDATTMALALQSRVPHAF